MIKSSKVLSLAIFLLTAFSASAQREIAQRAIDKVASAKNISYTRVMKGVNFFGGEVDIKNQVHIYGFKDSTAKAYSIDTYQEQTKIKYLFDGQKELELYFKDSVYRLKGPQSKLTASPLHELLSRVKQALSSNKYSTVKMADSTINKALCYHILVNHEDTVKKLYDRFHLFIDQKTDLILALRTELKGELSKEGMVLGTLSEKMNHVFSDFRISSDDKKNPVTVEIPQGFKPDVKTAMLAKGTIAPQWTLMSTNGGKLSLADLRDKVVLMEFTFNGCPACMLALPVLENMKAKYNDTDVVIVSVNYVDSKEAVEKFIKTNKVKSPIYINGRPVAKLYQVSAGPSFYLINKKGEIDWTSEGFFEDFESKVTANIEALR